MSEINFEKQEEIENLLTDKEKCDEIVNCLDEMNKKGIIGLDVNYMSYGIGVSETSYNEYIEEYDLNEFYLKYTLHILTELIEAFIEKKSLGEKNFDKDFIELNSYLIEKLREIILTDEFKQKLLFHISCLNDKLRSLNYQVIKKEELGHNITTALIELDIACNDGESKKVNFEVSKEKVKELRDKLDELCNKF
ncbi:COMM domain-containing protein [Halanaerobacter jeridensis]|uniref:COMM domain-containing protein n=1 Tax=Halanaerobacter jeridensis TaxID=706427 RepID=A0A938XNW2_9FIRM|nr:COMM domain-containing protein [Halanaerobacter jeridensis]MBM7556303.1 hypothetical protein [Halanaerobacter jeridensis]